MQGLRVPPDRVCALTTERATECGVETTRSGPHPPCDATGRPEGTRPTPHGEEGTESSKGVKLTALLAVCREREGRARICRPGG